MRKQTLIDASLLLAAASWPFVSFYAHNIHEGISTQHVLMLGLIFIASVLFAFFTLSYFYGNTRRFLSILVFLSIFFFLSTVIEYILESIGITPRYRVLLPVWFLTGSAVSWMLWRISHDDQSTKPIIIVLIALYVMPLWQLVEFAVGSFDEDHARQNLIQEPIERASLKNKPNVYFIVVDGYARSDVLMQQLNYDNSWFIEELKKKGFYVAAKSLANYPMTTYSIASTLEMTYLLNEDEKKKLHSHAIFHRYIAGDNAVVRFFKEHDYKFVYFESYKWTGFRCAEDIADECLYPSFENILLTNETVANLLRLTPIYEPLTKLAPRMERGSKKKLHDIQVLENYLREYLVAAEQPIFLYAHFISPHPPSTYGDDCSVVRPELDLQDWSDISAYTLQVKCVSHDLIRLINTIGALDQSSPVIVIQSDHGSATRDQFDKPLKEWVQEDVIERFGILNAMKIDDECKTNLHDDISSVNTFRVVIACLEKSAPDMLPDMSFFTNYKNYPNDNIVKIIAKDGKIMLEDY